MPQAGFLDDMIIAAFQSNAPLVMGIIVAAPRQNRNIPRCSYAMFLAIGAAAEVRDVFRLDLGDRGRYATDDSLAGQNLRLPSRAGCAKTRRLRLIERDV